MRFKMNESIDLLDYMNFNLAPVFLKEREQLDALNIDFNNLNGDEIMT